MSTTTATRPFETADPSDLPDGSERTTSSGRTLVLVGTFLAIALMLAVPVRSWFGQRAELDRLRDDITAAQQRVTFLTAAREQWRDAEFIAAQARIRLNMANPGEAALIALDARRATSAEQPAPTTWYGRLWASTSAKAGSPDAAAGVVPGAVP